jgi:hypothetical protein
MIGMIQSLSDHLIRAYGINWRARETQRTLVQSEKAGHETQLVDEPNIGPVQHNETVTMSNE